MNGFPIIEANEVALLFCDNNTGHVLDLDLQLKLNEEQTVYKIFPNLDMAILFAKNVVANNPEIESVIYNKEETPLRKININTIGLD